MNFIEKNTKKVALILCLATAGSAVTTVYAASNVDGWHGDGTNRVYKVEGKVKTNSWIFDENGTYYVDKDGKPLTNEWKTINGSLYYFDENGEKISGKQTIEGHTYYFQKTGILLTGWNETNDMYYDNYGQFVSGVKTIENKTYNFDENGKLAKGWATFNDKKVYFTENGLLANGVVKIDDKDYNFNSDGTITTGFKDIDEEKAYYDEYGFQTKGWKDIDGKKYYFNKDGFMATDTEYAGYKFDASGVATEIKEEKETTTTTTTTTSNTSKPTPVSQNPTGSGGNATAASIAAGQVGSAYVFGGSNPGGFDCSGLTSYAYRQVGISIPRTAGGQSGVGSAVSYENMQPGDLIVWSGGQHVSIYVGGGSMVHATNPSTGVITSSVSYWSSCSGQYISAIRRP
ncbi:MAG: NlpC/P60 family protein [Longicatena sp.]